MMLVRIKAFPHPSEFTEYPVYVKRVVRRLCEEKVLLFFTAKMLIDLVSVSSKDIFFVEYVPGSYRDLEKFVEVDKLEYIASYQTYHGVKKKILELLKEETVS